MGIRTAPFLAAFLACLSFASFACPAGSTCHGAVKSAWQRWIFGTIILSLIALFAVGFYHRWVTPNLREIPPAVRPATTAVIQSCLWSAIMGTYWEDELLRQASAVTSLSLRDRMGFYRAILQYCDLANYRAIYFVEIVRGDAIPLHRLLLNFKNTHAFLNLPASQRKNIEDWIKELQIIVQQREQDYTGH